MGKKIKQDSSHFLVKCYCKFKDYTSINDAKKKLVELGYKDCSFDDFSYDTLCTLTGVDSYGQQFGKPKFVSDVYSEITETKKENDFFGFDCKDNVDIFLEIASLKTGDDDKLKVLSRKLYDLSLETKEDDKTFVYAIKEKHHLYEDSINDWITNIKLLENHIYSSLEKAKANLPKFISNEDGNYSYEIIKLEVK